MIETNIIAEKQGASYSVPFEIDEKLFSMKLDTGAASTVISVDLFADNLTEERKKDITEYLDDRNVSHLDFTSASGDCFRGYLVHAKDVVIDDEVFGDFYYYLVIDNKRLIALIGNDFIDNCEFDHPIHSDIHISSFDMEAYGKTKTQIESDELMNYIDSL